MALTWASAVLPGLAHWIAGRRRAAVAIAAVAVALLAEHGAVDRAAAAAFLADPALAVTAGGQPVGGLRVTVGTGAATAAEKEKETAWH